MFTRIHEGITSASQVRRVYDELYGRHWLPVRTSLFTWIARLLAPGPGQTLLDVACGDAQLAAAVQPTGLIYFGVDISLSALQAAHHQELAVSDGAHLPFHDESFDFVTSIGSLEHYLDMERGIHEMARVLKPGGQACVLVPNAFSLTWNVLRVWRTGDLADDDGQPIQRFATRKAWSRLIEDNGLQVFRVLGLERRWPERLEEWREYVTHPKELLLACLTIWLPMDMRRFFVFLCTKNSAAQL